MQISQHGIDLIKSFEGYLVRLPDGGCRAYQCPAKVWTIGWGCTEGVSKGDVWTRQQADDRFAAEMRKHFRFVEQQAPWANQNEFDALASFSYNGGPGMLRQLLRRYPDKQKIADAFLLFDHGGGRKQRGLTRRRRAERALFLTPAKRQTIFKRLSEKRAETKEIVREDRGLTWGERYNSFCEYLGLSMAAIWALIEQAGAYLTDWRPLTFFAVLGLAYVASRYFRWNKIQKRKRLVIPAADKPKTAKQRKAA